MRYLERFYFKCEDCGADTENGQEPCEKCCDHSDVDFPECLDCGKDMSEVYAARAEDAYDAARGH